MKNLRENLIFSFILIFAIVLISRLFFLQIIKGNYYRALAFGIHNSFLESIERRGEIFFSGGEPLALNREYFFVFAIPNKVREKEKTAKVLSEVLGLNENEILEKLREDKSFVLIKEKLNDEEVEKIKKSNLAGIFVESRIGRYYPTKEFGFKHCWFRRRRRKWKIRIGRVL